MDGKTNVVDMNIDEEEGIGKGKRPKSQPSLWADFDEQRLAAIKRNLEDRFVVPPFSVLDTRQGYWQEGKRLWLELGIKSEVGRDENVLFSAGGQSRLNEILAERGRTAGGFIGVSVFDPVLCELMYKWFCPPGGAVLDPFAGGSVRGIVAEYLGYKYTGIELRPEQVASNEKQAQAIKLDPHWIIGDSETRLDEIADKSDFIFSCPPYFNLEVYSDLPGELSAMKQYEDFTLKYNRIVEKAVGKLRPNRFACFVVSNIRNSKTGYFYNFVADTADAFASAGAWLYNEAVLINPAGTLPIRVSRQFPVSRKLGKSHQNILIFFNGDPHRIKENFKKEV